MEVTVATTKKTADAAMEEPMCRETELFMGKYTESIAPIRNAVIANANVCTVSILHSLAVELHCCYCRHQLPKTGSVSRGTIKWNRQLGDTLGDGQQFHFSPASANQL
jgi:hypothetical protein